jgi:cell division protein FtsB
MREFQARRQLKKRIYSIPVLILLLIFLILVIDGTWKVFQKERESQTNLNRVKSQLGSLNQRNLALSNDINRLKTTQGVEDEIRSKYEVSKNGEGVVVIVDKDTNATTSSSTISFWQKFLNLFKRN